MNPEALAEIRQVVYAWRQAHPRATFDEIETEVQRHLAQVHAQVVADLIQPGAEAQAVAEEARPRCPQCRVPMQASGHRPRRVTTRQGSAITVRRAYYVCPACGAGVFPLDEALGLSGRTYSPNVPGWLSAAVHWPRARRLSQPHHRWLERLRQNETFGRSLTWSRYRARRSRPLRRPCCVVVIMDGFALSCSRPAGSSESSRAVLDTVM